MLKYQSVGVKIMKKMNLKGIFYDENGSFMPLTTNEGNDNEKKAHMRNTYMESEKDFFEEIFGNEKYYNKIINLLNEPVDKLFRRAAILQNELENGNLKMELDPEEIKGKTKEEIYLTMLEKAEIEICLCYAAARDKISNSINYSDLLVHSDLSLYDYEYRRGRY